MKQRRCERVCRIGRLCRGIAALSVAALTAMPCLAGGAGGVPDYDIHWATIGSPGNAGTMLSLGGPGGARPRGGVDYEYRISKLEITTAQWLEFVNTFSTQSSELAWFGTIGLTWGAVQDPNYFGPGIRWQLASLPAPALNPVYGITWRDAAMYCNWLHNDKQPTLAAIASGAYDTSTFTFNPDGSFNDQLTHSPDAKFWIPTLDEWMKAVHFDPNRFGPDQPGWWLHSNSSDTAPVPGLPGVGETSATLSQQIGFAANFIPLGAYPQTITPWGLLDASGGAEEWLEDAFIDPSEPPRFRLTDGPSIVFGPLGFDLGDRADRLSGGYFPSTFGAALSFRIASSIPAPSGVVVALPFLWTLTRRIR